jgi:hypothetical protein
MNQMVFFAAITMLALTGCVNSLDSTYAKENKKLEGEYSPYKYTKSNEAEGNVSYSLTPTGETDKTIALSSTLLYSDIFKAINDRCGFGENDLVETRVVTHKHPVYYEVWVFNDEISERDDKTSAISVVLRQFPNNGGVDILFYGDCHSKPVNMVHGR